MNLQEIDIVAVRVWMASNRIKTVKSLSEYTGISRNWLCTALRTGKVGELTVRRLEEKLGIPVQKED